MKVAVLGAGESGVGAALLARKLGYDIFVSDAGLIKENFRTQLLDKGIPYEEGKHIWTNIFDADLIVKSPGIPERAGLIQQLRKEGKTIISEIEFASRHATAPIIGITGSNGKTTTTRLTHHLLKTAGINAGLGGNVGYSFARNLTEGAFDYHVLELSSFQLDDIVTFRPDIAVILNITPDHLDRYDHKMELYVRSKFRIAMNQRKEDVLILNADDGVIQSYLKDHPLDVRVVNVPGRTASLYRLDLSGLVPGWEGVFDLTGSSLKGQHNLFNASCAILAAHTVGVENKAIQRGLDTFVNAPHRLEHVATIRGVDYINDSKATNVDSVYYALQAMEKPVVWIAGGTDKGNEYDQLLPLVAEKVKALICLGKENEKLWRAFSPILKNIEETESAKEAVTRAGIYAEEGDVVLLSPACASFDLFKNYEDRGDQFKTAVRELENR